MKTVTTKATIKRAVSDNTTKSFTSSAKYGIKGEAFFESLIVDYSLPNQIVGNKDIGLDYFCEWVHGQSPTGILFAVQVKTFTVSREATIRLINESSRDNRLKEYRITNTNLKINKNTLRYWKMLGIPIFLFAIAINKRNNKLDCFYKRYTKILTQDTSDFETVDCYSEFFKAYENNQFLAFQDIKEKKGGFARDLFIDHIRCNYSKGIITYLNPRSIGLNQFPKGHAYFDKLVIQYKDKISETYQMIKRILEEAPSCIDLMSGSGSDMSPTMPYATLTPVSTSSPSPSSGVDD